jgi:hypothetical protein
MIGRIIGLTLMVVSALSLWKREIAPLALGLLFTIGAFIVIWGPFIPIFMQKESKKG